MSQIMIRPYVDKKTANHGLEVHGMVIADNCEHKQELGYKYINGVKTYITGLNEDVPEVQNLPVEEKNARIYDIRKTVVYLEQSVAGNYNISEADIYNIEKVPVKKKAGAAADAKEEFTENKTFNPKFWEKVTKFRSVIPDKFEGNVVIRNYWDDIELKCTNRPTELDPSNPLNVIYIKAIEAGGFGMLCAPSLEQAQSGVHSFKFYLDKMEDNARIAVSEERRRNKAGALLEVLMDDTDRLFYIVKNIVSYPLSYRSKTSVNILYQDINKYLDGKGGEKDTTKAINNFIQLCDAERYTTGNLRMRAMVKDALALNIIVAKGDGMFHHNRRSVPVGKNFEDIVLYFDNPANSDMKADLTREIQAEWAK